VLHSNSENVRVDYIYDILTSCYYVRGSVPRSNAGYVDTDFFCDFLVSRHILFGSNFKEPW
jgi:hypothetical protein